MRVTIGSLAALLALGACDGGSPSSPDAGDADMTEDAAEDTADVPLVPGFEPDEAPTGAALYLTATLDDPAAPVVQVWARGLGMILGLACHVEFDGARFAAGAPVVEPAIGADTADEAGYLSAVGAGDVALGAARRGPDAGEVDLTAATLVATIPLRVVSAGTSRLDLTSAQARRADGSFVPLAVAGGRLTAGGAP
jgi:hypothetical protein